MAAIPVIRCGPPMATSFAYFRTPLQALIAGCVLALTACASLPPPTAELNAAGQAVARAADADADQYAPEDLGQARAMLGQAQAAMAERRESEARDLATRAAELAELALARSRDATTSAQLARRRAEIGDLRQRLGMEDVQ